MKILLKTITVITGVTLVGSNQSADSAFRDLTETIRSRTGKRVQWNRGTPQIDRGDEENASQQMSRDAVPITLFNEARNSRN